MSEVIEQALFRNMYEALDFGYSMKYASPYPSQSLERIERFNAWTDLTPQERFGQAAYIVDIAESNIKIPEVALIRLRHGHGEDKVNGVIGMSEHVQRVTKNEGDCLKMVVASIYKKELSLRDIAQRFSVSIASVRDDILVIRGHINSLEKIVDPEIDRLFKRHHGLIDN